MLKKHIYAGILAVALFSVPLSSAASTFAQEESAATEQTYNGDQASGQTNVEGNWTDSEEVNTVQESEISRKMTQAEKAQNAAENDEYGGAITIIAMVIVISVLILLSLLFLGFGKVSSKMLTKRKKEAHGVDDTTSEDHHDELDSGETIAAIGMALAEHFGKGHDMDEAILTIRRMKKSYSPWNSKIYNMRQMPELRRARGRH